MAKGADLLRLHDASALQAMRIAGSDPWLAARAIAGGAWEPALAPGRGDGRLVAESSEAATMAKLTDLPPTSIPSWPRRWRADGIESLYSHQAEAYETARDSDLILTSGTASGKSLSFNLPVLDGIAHDDKRRALYLYPTKALAQDQARKLGRAAAARACARRSTTATRRARTGPRSGGARTWC